MFTKILGKKKTNDEQDSQQQLTQKISQMNLSDMKYYVNNKIETFPICEDGILEVLKRLTTQDSTTQKYYLQEDDMDSKIKKAFELIISIAKSKKITISAVEMIQEFITTYDEIIKKYDRTNKEIYESRFSDAIKFALDNIEKMNTINSKASILNE